MNTGGGGIGLAFAASITGCGGSGGSGGGATTSGTSASGEEGGGADASVLGSGCPNAALVAGLSDPGSGDKKRRTDPLSSYGGPGAAPSEGADRLGVIGAWSTSTKCERCALGSTLSRC